MQGIHGSPNLLSGTILADSSHRLRRFHTRTILVREQGGNVVYKVAATEEARAFLELITVRERENAEYLQGHFHVLCGSLREEGNPLRVSRRRLRWPRASAVELGSGHCDRADELLGLYVRKVRALRAQPRLPFGVPFHDRG